MSKDNPFPWLTNALTRPFGAPVEPYGRCLSPFTSPFALIEPEVPQSERRAVAWANLPDGPFPGCKTTREGRLIFEQEYGNRQSPFGWEAGHIVAEVAGGRATRDNLIAQQWEDNASEGGSLGLLRNALTGK